MTIPNPIPFLPKLFQRRFYRGDSAYVRPLPDDELQEYLENVTDLDGTIDLWNQVSGIPGMLDATTQQEVIQQALKLFTSLFDAVSGLWRFLSGSRRVPASRVRLGVLRVSKFTEREMRDLTTRLVSGEISREQWYNAMRQAMKDEYRAAWLASIGGKGNYTRSEISKFGHAMRPHYRWLNNFLEELNSGKQPLNGRAVVRAGMYGRAGNGIYQNNLRRVASENGFRYARRVLGETENHCHDTANRPGCIELAALGFVSIEQVVEIGDASCFSNCLCKYQFKR